MESYIQSSLLNDFIFCPRSIYFHGVYGNADVSLYHSSSQTSGKAAHESIEAKTYSTKNEILQGIEFYSEKYKIVGKIDLFDVKKGVLSERKKEIKIVYDGYIFQLYAQYFGLVEMGYDVIQMVLYDLTHNKTYPILVPSEDPIFFAKFEKLVSDLQNFDLEKEFFPNVNKCKNCIYSNLCDKSLC